MVRVILTEHCGYAAAKASNSGVCAFVKDPIATQTTAILAHHPLTVIFIPLMMSSAAGKTRSGVSNVESHSMERTRTGS
jgi:hypothetical protein